jgi:hypothetical protein
MRRRSPFPARGEGRGPTSEKKIILFIDNFILPCAEGFSCFSGNAHAVAALRALHNAGIGGAATGASGIPG